MNQVAAPGVIVVDVVPSFLQVLGVTPPANVTRQGNLVGVTVSTPAPGQSVSFTITTRAIAPSGQRGAPGNFNLVQAFDSTGVAVSNVVATEIIVAAAPSATPVPTASATVAPTTQPTASPSTPASLPNTGANTTSWLMLVMLAGSLLGAGVAVQVMLRRRTR